MHILHTFFYETTLLSISSTQVYIPKIKDTHYYNIKQTIKPFKISKKKKKKRKT